MPTSTLTKTRILLLFLLLEALEALVTAAALLSAKSDPTNAILFGYSPTRLLSAIVFLAIGATFSSLAWGLWRSRQWAKNLLLRFDHWASDSQRFEPFIVACLAVALISTYLYSVAAVIPGVAKAYLLRLTPSLLFLTLTSLQILLAAHLLGYTGRITEKLRGSKTLRAAVLVFGLLLILSAFIAFTGVGLLPDSPDSFFRGWGDPGVPILMSQVILAWGLAFSLTFLGLRVSRTSTLKRWGASLAQRHVRLDLLIALLIWAVAAFIWLREPLPPNWFAPAPQPPNFEVYPYSDASLFDRVAHSILLGEGFKVGVNPIPRRPLYGLFLAALHTLTGPGYQGLVTLQVIVLASFPALVYMLGKTAHSRTAGILAAALVILRERNAIAVADIVNVSTSKLLMSDMPTALGVALFAWLLFRWLRKRDAVPLLLTGGAIGLLMLIRFQSALLLLTAPLISLLQKDSLKRGITNTLIIFFGALLAITPWLWRNYQVTDDLVFGDISEAQLLAIRYSPLEESDKLGLLPGESPSEYSSRMVAVVIQSIINDPGRALRAFTASFLHNGLDTVLILPVVYDFLDLRDLVMDYPFWGYWGGNFPPGTILPLYLNLAILAIGIAAAWKKHHLIGLAPLLIHTLYNVGNSAANSSGWRFILPVDWIALLYYSIGLVQLTVWVLKVLPKKSTNLSLITETNDQITPAPSTSLTPTLNWGFTLAASLIFLTGSTILLGEYAIPRRYQPGDKHELYNSLVAGGRLDHLNGEQRATLDRLLNDEDSLVIQGTALYPRFYHAGDGEGGTAGLPFRPRSCDRLGFYLAGHRQADVILPMQAPPAQFPHAAEVLAIGYAQPASGIIQAEALVVFTQSGNFYYQASSPQLPCPLSN